MLSIEKALPFTVFHEKNRLFFNVHGKKTVDRLLDILDRSAYLSKKPLDKF